MPRKSKGTAPPEVPEIPSPDTGNEDAAKEATCSPCSREGRKVEATKFCEDCNEHLCEKCVHDHKKFVVTQTHRIVGKQKPPNVSPKQKLTDKCTHHEDKTLELFCSDHDELCCSVCVAVGHRTCNDVVYISQAAIGVESCLELLEVKDELLKVKANVDELRSKREENQLSVQQQQDGIINSILDMRIRVTDILDKLERTARNELQVRYDTVITEIDADVKTCEDISYTLSALTTKIETTTDNDPELFVTMKKAKKSMSEGRSVLGSISQNLGKERLLFMADRTLENLLINLESLGQFGEDTHAYKAQLEGEYNISLSSDLGSSDDNTGSVSLPDGKVILTNTHHKRLKLLSTHYRVIDHVDLPGKPYDVCLASPFEAITSLREEKLLQFVSVEKKMKISRQMKIGVSCYGVASQNGEVFVACIGGQYENRPMLRVYNMSGRLLRVFEKGTDGLQIFSSPRNIIISPDGTMLHVTDREHGMITVGLLGNVISQYRNARLDSPRGITVDDDGNIFVCGQNSHNVVQLNAAGEETGVVMKDRAHFNRPQSVVYLKKSPRSFLLVTFLKSKYIKVYALA